MTYGELKETYPLVYKELLNWNIKKGVGIKSNETFIDKSGYWDLHHLGYYFWSAFYFKDEEKIKK